jgi:hypothetical protein
VDSPSFHPVGRAIHAAITMLPVLIFVILSMPAWLSWPFLSTERRNTVNLMMEQMTDWTRVFLHHTKNACQSLPKGRCSTYCYQPKTSKHRPAAERQANRAVEE